MDNNFIQNVLIKDSLSAIEFSTILNVCNQKPAKYFQELILSATLCGKLVPVHKPTPYIPDLNPRIKEVYIIKDDSSVYATEALISWAKTKGFILPEVCQKTDVRSDLNETERTKLLEILLGMAIYAFKYDPKATRNFATGGNKNSIRAALQTSGLDADEDTIRSYLDEAVKLFEHKLKK